DRRHRGPFDYDLAAHHYPDHRVEDVAIWEGHDVVDEPLHDGERDVAHAPDAQTVDDRAALDCLDAARVDARLHGRPVRRLHANHTDLGIMALRHHGDPGDQATAADWHYNRVDVRPVLDDFQTERSLSRDELLVVERMYVRESLSAHELFGFLIGFVPDGAVEHDFGA